ncbi:MAG TPA: hypothetical protein VGQ59_02605, partial [Cyclobacteriaceae bacterium]|nr:hypothetical protein [Cyclobacteriaceae bacterium]
MQMFSFLKSPKNPKPVTFHIGSSAYLSIKDNTPEQPSPLDGLKQEIQKKLDLYQTDEKSAGNPLAREVSQYTTRLNMIRQEIELASKKSVDANTVTTFKKDIADAEKTFSEAVQTALYNILAKIIMNFALWKKEVNQYVGGGIPFKVGDKTVRVPTV